jgi:hypothetical protein
MSVPGKTTTWGGARNGMGGGKGMFRRTSFRAIDITGNKVMPTKKRIPHNNFFIFPPFSKLMFTFKPKIHFEEMGFCNFPSTYLG